jgi:UTP--glucose-1-phosphate uridylyltransferase
VQLTDALRLLRKEERIYGYVFEGRRYDIGTKLDWMKAHFELTLMREEFRDPLMRFMKEWLDGA